MADADVPGWRNFFERIRRDLYEYHLVRRGSLPELSPKIPFDYYVSLYQHAPVEYVQEADARVHAKLNGGPLPARLLTLARVRRFNKLSGWLLYTASSESASSYVPGLQYGVMGHYHKDVEAFRYRLTRLMLIQENPEQTAIYAAESPFLPWFYDSMSEAENTTVVEYDTSGLRGKAESGYGRLLSAYKALLA